MHKRMDMKRWLVVSLFATCNTYAQVSFPQDTIAYNNLFNNRQSIAFDSQGRIHVAYSGQTGTMSATREIYYATDSAGLIVTRQVTTNAVDDNYPTIVVDRNDNVHIGFLGRDAGNQFQVQYTRLVNGSFTAPRYITQGDNKATPYCAIGPDSVMHFVYHTFPQTGTQYLYYRQYDLRDSTLYSAIQLIDAGITGDFDAAVAVDTSGSVHIVVKSGSASGGPLKYYTNRTGTLQEMPTGVAVPVDYPRVLVAPDNVVHILYRNSTTEILQVVNNSTGNFGTPVSVTPAGQRPAGYHNFAADDENRLFIVYQSSLSTSGRGWFIVHGKDGVFSDTLNVFDLTPEYVTRNTSAVAARADGEIAVTYSPGAVRSGSVVCDIFMKRGALETTGLNGTTALPTSSVLRQNYPNPFNPSTTIAYTVERQAFVVMKVYDMLGREVATLVNEETAPGTHKVTWTGDGMSGGVYFCRMQSGGYSSTRKMILLK